MNVSRSVEQPGKYDADRTRTLSTMRDPYTIDSEMRLLAAVRRSIRDHGGEPSSRQVDELLDERAELTGS
jgi:hypothetical protein